MFHRMLLLLEHYVRGLPGPVTKFCHNLHAALHGNPRFTNYQICILELFAELNIQIEEKYINQVYVLAPSFLTKESVSTYICDNVACSNVSLVVWGCHPIQSSLMRYV